MENIQPSGWKQRYLSKTNFSIPNCKYNKEIALSEQTNELTESKNHTSKKKSDIKKSYLKFI